MPTTDPRAFWKIGAIALAVVALGLAILLFRANADADKRENDIDKLAERMQVLESHPIKSNPADFGPSVSRGQAAYPLGPVPLDGEAAGMTAEDAEARNKQLLKTLEARFSQQPADGNAPRVEIDMLQAMNDKQLAGGGIAPEDPDVSCRRDVCRISGVFRSTADATDWAVLYLTTVGAQYVGKAQSAYARNPDGSVRVMLYANRPAATP